MRRTLLSILACPVCQGTLSLEATETDSNGDVRVGQLDCGVCRHRYPINRGIPRFIQDHPADGSFGLQWNTFREEQLDSLNGAHLSADRLHVETGWPPDELRNEWVLEIGCGAGRFLEVMAASGCDLVGVDVSSAIDAAAMTVKGRPNVDLVQADVYHLPFRPGLFHACYCIGVAQHTPDPQGAISALARMVKVGGRLAITVYERKPWTRLNGKYLLRPITRRLNKRALLAGIEMTMPVLFPVTEVLFRIPVLGRLAAFVLPVANYVDVRELSLKQRYRTAVLDTFDRLAPEHDHPLTETEVRTALGREQVDDVQRLPNPGVNVVATRRRALEGETR